MSTSSSQLRRERRKRQQKRQQLSTARSKAATLPSNILRLIFAYLHQKHPRGSVNAIMLDNLKRLKELASVNRQWRSVAKGQFYRVAFLAVRELKHDVDSIGIMRMSSNIRLIRDVGEIDRVRELQINMRCGSQLLNDLGCILLEEGLCGSSWPGIERLQFNILDHPNNSANASEAMCEPETLSAFNMFLSRALPSLREIYYTGFSDNPQNTFNPIAPLIEERLYGPAPIRVLRLSSDCKLKLKGRVGDPDAPIVLERLSINYEKTFFITLLPIVQANTLVELKLGPSFCNFIWDSFVVDGAPGSPEGRLVFSRLESLSLCFRLGMGLDIPPSLLRMHDSDSYFQSARLGTPYFSVLTSLSINYFPYNLTQFLSLFASSPISKLSITGKKSRIPDDLDLSQFSRLRSFLLLSYDHMELSERDQPGNSRTTISSVFTTCGSALRHLKLGIPTIGSIERQLTTPVFADSLVTLALGGNISVRDVELLLPMLSNLQKLHISALAFPPVSSPSVLVQRYHRLNTPQQLPPLNTSVRVLQAEHSKCLGPLPTWPNPYNVKPSKDNEESQYRGLLLKLACRLPSLYMLEVKEGSFGAVEKSIQALVKSDIAPDCIGHLQRLLLRVIGESIEFFS
ncbi:hypothetical protein GGH92_000587 [Coemansia sp. RSA 2673]|nr:hypothetical protein GGH92_000587 [Coemansia sp. RSA 2673]